MCSKKNNIAQFPHVKRAFVEVSSPSLLFKAWDMAGFWDVIDFRIWFGTYLYMTYFAMLQIWGRDLGNWILRWSGWLNPMGFIFSLSLSFLRSFPFAVVVAGLFLLYCCTMDDMNATHKRLSTTLRHVKMSVIAMDVKLWQQSALSKREKAATQENLKDLKLPVSPSREFVSRALVSSRKQANTVNFLISLILYVFFCMWFPFWYFFASTHADILICSLIFPVWRRSMEVLLDFCPFLVKWMHCAVVARWIQIIRKLFFCFQIFKKIQ